MPLRTPEDPRESARSAAPPSQQSPEPRRDRKRALSDFKIRSQRSPRAAAIAVLGHLVLGVLLLRAITFETGFRDYFGFGAEDAPRQESITYVETAPAPPPEAVVQPMPAASTTERAAAPTESRGPVIGDGVAAVGAAPPRLVAPGRDSAAVNRLPPNEAALVGVVPRADDRLWTVGDLRALRDEVRAAAVAASGGLPGARQLDSVITWAIGSARDSLDSLAVIQGMGPRTANWTRKDASGGTWGLDPSGIKLGKVTIPSALLAFLPLSAQQALSGNPTDFDRARRLNLAQSDIARFRNAGAGNDQFKMLVEELRERRDRERANRRAAGGPVVAPGTSGRP